MNAKLASKKLTKQKQVQKYLSRNIKLTLTKPNFFLIETNKKICKFPLAQNTDAHRKLLGHQTAQYEATRRYNIGRKLF